MLTLRKLTAIGVFLAALGPSAYLAWTLRTMPHLGFYHDDSIYWVSGRSLAMGDGYRIQSLPGQPYQTKYPPLYPALLAAIWKLDPQFPANLPLATLFAWLLLPLFLAALWFLLREYGFSLRERYLLILMAALSPVTAVFSFSLMPELLFTALLLASLILAERAMQPEAPRWLALVSGICAALAYLAKSIAAPLLLTVPLCLALRRHFRKAALFVAAMLPAIAGWQWWMARHLTHSRDLVTLYYTNYVGFQIYNVPLHDLPLVIWYNLDGFLQGAGKLLIFDLPYGSKHLERVVAIAAIAGCVRLTMSKRALQYPLAALGMSAILLVWHFPPDQRFVFPLYPFLLMGLATEVRNICRALRLAWSKPAFADRLAVAGFGALLTGLAAFGIFCTVFGLVHVIPDLFASYQTDFAARERAYQWINRNLPREANVYAYQDPVMFLYTGHKACHLPIPPKFLYHGDDGGIDRLMGSMADFARGYQLDYLLLTPDDYYRGLDAKGTHGLTEAMQSDAFQKLYASNRVAIYKLNAAISTTASFGSVLKVRDGKKFEGPDHSGPPTLLQWNSRPSWFSHRLDGTRTLMGLSSVYQWQPPLNRHSRNTATSNGTNRSDKRLQELFIRKLRKYWKVRWTPGRRFVNADNVQVSSLRSSGPISIAISTLNPCSFASAWHCRLLPLDVRLILGVVLDLDHASNSDRSHT